MKDYSNITFPSHYFAKKFIKENNLPPKYRIVKLAWFYADAGSYIIMV